MCFDKRGLKSFILKEDTYVIKCCNQAVLLYAYFPAAFGFKYYPGKTYRKSIWNKIIASRATSLEGEVFHSWNVENSIEMVQDSHGRRDLGVFLIPKGTRVYENTEYEQFASFAIKYIGPLNDELAKLILAQAPKDEESKPIT